MHKSVISNLRTNPKTEQLVITRIAQGSKYQEIYEEIGVPVSTIKKIKKRNESLLIEVRQKNIRIEASIVVDNLQKVNKLIARRLDRVLEGKETIADRDLVNIAREMHSQAELNEAKVGSEVHGQQDEERSREIFRALEEQDFTKLHHLVFPEG